jgi:hypothetical protein
MMKGRNYSGGAGHGVCQRSDEYDAQVCAYSVDFT